RTMEFYRRIGIAERVRALGYPADNPMDVFLTTRLSDPPIAVLKYPSVGERRRQIADSPNGAFLLEPYQLVSQNKLEPLLKEVAEGTPNVAVRYGCGLEDFTQDDSGVTVEALTVDGEREELRARYLVGCDGGSSTVRKKAGITLEGQGRIRALVQVIFRSDDLYDKIVTGRGRHEHGSRRRLRSFLEARRHDPWVGRSWPARRLRARAPSDRPAQRRRRRLGRSRRADLAHRGNTGGLQRHAGRRGAAGQAGGTVRNRASADARHGRR